MVAWQLWSRVRDRDADDRNRAARARDETSRIEQQAQSDRFKAAARRDRNRMPGNPADSPASPPQSPPVTAMAAVVFAGLR